MHNHTTNVLPSGSNFQYLINKKINRGIIIYYDGSVFEYEIGNRVKGISFKKIYDRKFAELLERWYNYDKLIEILENAYGESHEIKIKRY